jgi:hypothetical protein
MKKIFKRYLLALGVGSAIMFSSCQKYLDVNIDPNNPSTADEKLLLPAAELAVGIGLGDRYNNITLFGLNIGLVGLEFLKQPLIAMN